MARSPDTGTIPVVTWYNDSYERLQHLVVGSSVLITPEGMVGIVPVQGVYRLSVSWVEWDPETGYPYANIPSSVATCVVRTYVGSSNSLLLAIVEDEDSRFALNDATKFNVALVDNTNATSGVSVSIGGDMEIENAVVHSELDSLIVCSF